MSTLEIPKFHETFNPILDILSNGKTIHSREMIELVIEKFYSQLPKELLNEKTKSGEVLIKNRIAWGKSYLKKGGFIEYPERGYVKITEKGLSQTSKLTLQNLEQESSVLEFYKTEKSAEQEIQNTKNATPQDLIDEGFGQIENELHAELLDKLKKLDPFYFEKVVLMLLNKMGYGEFVETSKTGDGGIDGIINEDKLGLDKIFIQAKRYSENKVRETEIRNFIGAMSGDTNKGVFVTTSTFDDKAMKKAKEAHHSIILIDGEKLVKLMTQYNVGVQIEQVYEIKRIDIDFFEGQ